MKKSIIITGLLALSTFLAGHACAHSPFCRCIDNGDETITCTGGFSDGSSACGAVISVKDKSGKTLHAGKMDEDSEHTFDKPKVPYAVYFDAGPRHMIEIPDDWIFE